jgi:hypothetical protein
MSVNYERIKTHPGYFYTLDMELGFCLDKNHNIIQLSRDDHIYTSIEMSHYFDIVKDKNIRWDYINEQMKIYQQKIESLFEKLAVGSTENSEFYLYENEPFILPSYEKKQLVIFQDVGILRIDK